MNNQINNEGRNPSIHEFSLSEIQELQQKGYKFLVIGFLSNESNELHPAKKEQEVVEDRLVPIDDTCKRLFVSKPTLFRWNRSGYLQHVKVGRKTFYRESDIRKIESLHNSENNQ